MLVSKYLQELSKEEEERVTSFNSNQYYKGKEHRIRGAHFLASYNNSRSNKFMRIMEDIFFCENINLLEGGY